MNLFDYIIVGQGLAGSALTAQLLLRKKKVLVIDWPQGNISSPLAAGLFNPFTGRKMIRTWQAETLFPYLENFYQKVQRYTGEKFFFPTPIYRPFLSVEEQNEWMGMSADPLPGSFIGEITTNTRYPEFVNDHFGGLVLKSGGYIDTVRYICAVRDWVRKENSYLEEKFDFSAFLTNGSGVQYKNMFSHHIIFSEGVNALSNESFRWVPIKPLKGETLTIRATLRDGIIFNRGVYVVPDRRENFWRVGATYEHGAFEPAPTLKGRKELEEKLRELITGPYEVVDHQWGVRPTTPDRRPVVGAHPENSDVFFFNGFGTKGVSLTPYFSHLLIESIENKTPINQEIDISRYKSLYWKSRE